MNLWHKSNTKTSLFSFTSRRSILTLCLIIIFLPGSSYTQSTEKYLEGYVVLINGDTLKGTVMDRDESAFGGLLKKIRFRPEKGWRKKYKPQQLHSYKRGNDMFKTIWFSNEAKILKQYYYSEPGRGEEVFVKVIYSGSIDYYHREWTDEDNNNIDHLPLIKRPNTNQMVRVTQGIFGLKRKKLAEYFFECPELSTAILTKELSSVDELIRVYEQSCTQ